MTRSRSPVIPSAMTRMDDDMPPLPEPDLVSCLIIEQVQPHMMAMRLHWPDDLATRPQIWDLPAGKQQFGPAPECFGIVLHRVAFDGFELRLWWDGSYHSWPHLSRQAVIDSCLSRLLSALGSDLSFMLDQPVLPAPRTGEDKVA